MPPTRAQVVAQRLRDRILQGDLPPGARLRQNEIAAQLGVSSTPVREAFAMLEREGLVVTRSHQGVIVFNPTFEEFEEAYEIRIPLECAILAKAIPNFSQADLDALRKLLDQMDASRGDPSLGPGLNEQFHARLYAPANRPRLEQLVRALRDECLAYMRWIAPAWTDHEISEAQHKSIYAACVARDVERATAELRVHLQHSVDAVAAHLSTRSDKSELRKGLASENSVSGPRHS